MTVAPLSLEHSRILVISHDQGILTLISNTLKNHCKEVKVAHGGKKALKTIQSTPSPSIILLDAAMPKADSEEVFKQLKATQLSSDIPVIAVIDNDDHSSATFDFAKDVVDYITKPCNPAIVMARVKTQLELKRMQGLLSNQDNLMPDQVNKQTADLRVSQDVMIHAMAYLAKTRENVTGNHIFRDQYYVKVLANKLRSNPSFEQFLNDDAITLLCMTAPLNDIGHVGIPDRILLKPSRLTPEEFEIMKSHTRSGLDVIIKAERHLGTELPVFKFAKEIINSHHEKWDGSGYPDGLAGNDIPVSARIMGIADVYDALISRRIYKAAVPHTEAVSIILDGKGTQFDPDIVDAFHAVHEEFQRIAQTYADNDLDFRKKIDYLEKAIAIEP